MKTQRIYLSVLMLVIIMPLSIKGVSAISKDRAIADKPQTIYTIQLGSYLTFSRAQGEFNYFMEVLTKKYRSFLRVEKVGTFYSVRLGKFESYSSTKKYLESLIPKNSKARILKAFLKYDRIRSCICY
jgi:hypothetical protein